jgi:hypothetical protein
MLSLNAFFKAKKLARSNDIMLHGPGIAGTTPKPLFLDKHTNTFY